MSEEKEIKIRVLDDITIEKTKQILEGLFKVKFGESEQDKDVYYDFEDNFFFNLNHSLRIRNNNEISYKALFYMPEKKPNPWFVLEKEYKLPISKEDLINLFDIANISHDLEIPDIIGADQLKKVLEMLKFVEKIKIEKTRWSGKNENHIICVDSVNELGLFVEIEVKDDVFLDMFRNKLSFQFEEVRQGYTNLYAKEILKMDVPDFGKNILENPEWNFLNGQKQLVQQILNNQE